MVKSRMSESGIKVLKLAVEKPSRPTDHLQPQLIRDPLLCRIAMTGAITLDLLDRMLAPLARQHLLPPLPDQTLAPLRDHPAGSAMAYHRDRKPCRNHGLVCLSVAATDSLITTLHPASTHALGLPIMVDLIVVVIPSVSHLEIGVTCLLDDDTAEPLNIDTLAGMEVKTFGNHHETITMNAECAHRLIICAVL